MDRDELKRSSNYVIGVTRFNQVTEERNLDIQTRNNVWHFFLNRLLRALVYGLGKIFQDKHRCRSQQEAAGDYQRIPILAPRWRQIL